MYIYIYIYYRIKELRIKLVIETNIYYDARSKKHQNLLCRLCWQACEYFQHQLRIVVKTLFKISYKIHTKNYKIKAGSRLTRSGLDDVTLRKGLLGVWTLPLSKFYVLLTVHLDTSG
jgi:hypothetical protein